MTWGDAIALALIAVGVPSMVYCRIRAAHYRCLLAALNMHIAGCSEVEIRGIFGRKVCAAIYGDSKASGTHAAAGKA